MKQAAKVNCILISLFVIVNSWAQLSHRHCLITRTVKVCVYWCLCEHVHEFLYRRSYQRGLQFNYHMLSDTCSYKVNTKHRTLVFLHMEPSGLLSSPKNCKEFGSPAMSSPRPRLPSQAVVRRCSLAFPYKSVSWTRPSERWLATLLPELSAQLREGFLSSPGPAFSQSYRPTERDRSRRLAPLPLFASLESSQLETNRAASMQ